MLAAIVPPLHLSSMLSSRAFRARPHSPTLLTLAALGCLVAPLGAQSGGALPTSASRAPTPATATNRAVTGALGGMVFDSITFTPLAGATVLLTHASRNDVDPISLVADTSGRFLARDLVPGRWVVTFFHHSADEYGISPVPKDVSVGEGTISNVTLGLPGPRELRIALCGRAPSDSVGVLVGSVRDEETGQFLAGASVTVSWRVIDMNAGTGVKMSTQRVPTTTSSDGTYRLCGLPTEDPLSIRATARGTRPGETLRSGEVFAALAPGGITRLQLGVGHLPTDAVVADDKTNSARGTRLTGRARLGGVVSDPQGKPKSDVRVIVLGTGQQVTTNDAGAFRFDSLPVGSWTVEARAIGTTPVRATVQLAPDSLTRSSLIFAAWKPTLDRVVVYGKPPMEQRFMDDFLERRDRGLGTFLTQAEIAERNIQQLSHLLYTIPSVRVRQNPRAGRSPMIEGPGGCKAEVFVNGARVADGDTDVDALVRPYDILAIEVHDQVNGVPAQFGATNQCLVVGIWTRR